MKKKQQISDEQAATALPFKTSDTSSLKGRRNTSADNSKQSTNAPPASDTAIPEATKVEWLQSIGVAIGQAHHGTKAIGVDLVVGAAKCGLLLMAAKQLLPHGTFEAWFEKTGFGFSKVTRCKYMQLVEALTSQAKSKPDSLLKILPSKDGTPMTFVFDEVQIRALVGEVCGGRNLSDLYADWNIANPSQRQSSSQPSVTVDQNQGGSHMVTRWVGVAKRIPDMFVRLSGNEQSDLISYLEGILKQLQQLHAQKHGQRTNTGEGTA